MDDDSAEAQAEGDPAKARAGAAQDNPAEARADIPEPGPDLADALVAMAETSLANGLCALPGGQRSQVVLHLGPGRCCIDDGPALDLHAALRLSCDAQLLPLKTDEAGRVLDVGRARRSISPAIRRALTFRDRGCRFPGCTNTRFVDAHHVLHHAHGGETKLSNLTLLCRRHHRLVHEGGCSVTAQPGGFEFTDPDGRPIPRVPALPAAEDPLPPSAGRPAAGHQGPWDCGQAIEGLLLDDGLLSGAA